MYVYVRNQDSTPLMPCTPAKARKLLQAGKAKVVEHRPFTIQLTWQCEGRLAFKRVKGEPASARPKDCQLLERGRTIMWEKVS